MRMILEMIYQNMPVLKTLIVVLSLLFIVLSIDAIKHSPSKINNSVE
jgi:hypothetical protein